MRRNKSQHQDGSKLGDIKQGRGLQSQRVRDDETGRKMSQKENEKSLEEVYNQGLEPGTRCPLDFSLFLISTDLCFYLCILSY